MIKYEGENIESSRIAYFLILSSELLKSDELGVPSRQQATSRLAVWTPTHVAIKLTN
jgi:hypothetical protein